jgi:alpha-amylase
MPRFLAFLFLASHLFLFSCNNQNTVLSASGDDSAAVIDGHPAWILQGNIYEVNVRQYTPEGTLKAFSQHLQRLKDMGVQTLWFMPIQPISVVDRKGELGSYYAIADYTAINPEFGTMQDWKELVQQAHDLGMKVIIDWVPNHSGADHRWLKSHPDFYEQDSAGNFIAPFDWTDVRKLNYKNPVLVDSMLASMKFWVSETGIDGFRCDVAGELPKEFWTRAIAELKQMKNLFMLAESNDAWLHETGFDASYTWDEFNMMKQIAKGARPAFAMDSVLRKIDTSFLPNAIRMYFTSNHDENSWNLADWKTMPGPVHAPFAVLTQTLPRSVPLIYSGQEEPHLDSLRFFYKDTIEFKNFQRESFYRTLLTLRKENSGLAANAAFKKLPTTNDAALYAFERERDGQKVLVVVNLSQQPQKLTWQQAPSVSSWTNVFSGQNENVSESLSLEPWGYLVYQLKK